MCEALGYNVESLKRTRIMNITLSNLSPGKWRYFTPVEIDTINQMLKNSSKTADGAEGMDE
jgi:23S rRNA pseudouridine2604 synthase